MDRPFPSYRGSEPFAFVCYSHKDADTVFSDLAELDRQGLRFWYDEGIQAGTSWRAEIASAIKGANKFLFFISAASLESTHCLREVDYALSHDLDIIPVYLEDCTLPGELDLVLNRVHALFRNRDPRFMEHLQSALEGKRARVPLGPARGGRKRRWALPLLAVIAAVALAPLIWQQWGRSTDRGETPTLTSAAPSAYDRYLEGLELMERWDLGDNLERAIGLFREAAGIEPDFALAYARLAEALRLRYAITREGNWLEEAADNASEAARLNPGLAPVQVALGQVQAAQGNHDLAFAAFERALAIDPNDAAANQAIAKAYERHGRLDDAEAAFQKALALEPESLLLRDSYANFLYRQGRFEDAAGQWRSVIRQAPDHFGALVNLGSALSELGKLSEAITMYERAIEIRPNYIAYVNLGTAYGRAARYAEAAEAFRQALAIDDSDWLAWGNLGYAYAWMGGMDDLAAGTFAHAIELAEAARRDNPRDPFVHSDLALYYAKSAQPEPAAERLQTALALAPESGEILAAAAEVNELLGQRERAVVAAQKSLAFGFPRHRLQRNPELTDLLADPRLQSNP